MREIRALIWKEWCETRLFLWIGWGLFFGMAIVGGIEGMAMYAHGFEFNASPWIIMCGWVLAIVMGVAGTCRDLKPKLEDFWQSRPMGRLPLFVVKYLVGLAVLLVACNVPVMVELWTNRDPTQAKVALALSFLWMAVFTTAFACGCLFRKPAHAAAVTLVVVLLIYFLPIVFPPLGRFNVDRVLSSNGQQSIPNVAFDLAVATLFVVAGMGLMAVLTLRLRWHIESEQPLIYGAAGVAFLVLLESAAFQLGTDLPVLGAVDVSQPAYQVRAINVEQLNGWVTWQNWDLLRSDSWDCVGTPFSISDNRIQLGKKREIRSLDDPWIGFDSRTVGNEHYPAARYEVRLNQSETDGSGVARLTARSGTIGSNQWQGIPIELWKGPEDQILQPYVHVWGDRLYVIGDRTIVFSIVDPLQPKLLSDQPIKWRTRASVFTSEEPTVDLPAIPGLPASERLNFALTAYQFDPMFRSFDSALWCRVYEPDPNHPERSAILEELRLKSLTDDRAQYKLIGKRERGMADWILQQSPFFSSAIIKNGFLYATQWGCVSVFSLDDAKPLRMIAHFAAPKVQMCVPLDDGRAIAAGGGKIWLLGPPAGR